MNIAGSGAHRTARLAVTAALVLGWLAFLLLAWQAFATVPDAERLAQSRMAAIPTLQTLALIMLRSGLELAALAALTWPRRRLYTARLGLAAALLAIYFVVTTPLSVSALQWTHRRWLATIAAGLFLAFTGFAAARLAQRLASAGKA
jgi:hypothetical protein